MADPFSMGTMGAIGLGSNIASGILGIGKAGTQAAQQRLSLQGQMMKTIADAFGMEVQAQQYGYEANKNRYQAAVADINKEISKGNATYAREVGEVEAQQAGMKARAELGEMVAAQGASGLDVNVGSAVKVRESMIEIGDYTQKIVRASAAKKAYGYDIEAMQYGAQADVYRYTATQNEAQAGEALKGAAFARQGLGLQEKAMGLVGQAEGINIMGSLVGMAGSVSDKWTSGSMTGLTKSIFG
jgi:hypothetical protein